MSGVMPPTMYLLVRSAEVIGTFRNTLDVANYLGIEVVDRVVYFMGESMNPTYGEDWEGSLPILENWSRHYLKKNLPPSYKLYRVLL